MKKEELSSLFSSTEVLSPSSIIRTVKKVETEKVFEGNDDNKDNDDKENHQWIEFFEDIANDINLDDDDDDEYNDNDDRNEGATAGRSSSSITIKTEVEVPDSIPSKSSMIEMEEEVDEEVLTSIINNTLVWGDGTISSGVTTCEDQQQVKKEGKKKEEEETAAAAAEKKDDNGNDKGYKSWAEDIFPNTDDEFPTAASTNHCVRRKFNSNNNKDYNDVDVDVDDNIDDERKPPPKKKIRVLAAAEEDINIKADEVHTDNDNDDDDGDGDGDGDGTSPKSIPADTKYNKVQNQCWNKMFRQLVDYKEKHQTTYVPHKCNEHPQLGRWSSKQRERYKKETISKHRVALLDGILFVWDPCHVKWMEMYQRLITYKKQHKTTSVPKSYTEVDSKLGPWVECQRTSYKKKKLSVERINDLESIGFSWKLRDSVPAIPWNEMYERLVAYKKYHQSALVPTRYKEDPRLGTWVQTQRFKYNKGKLLEKRIELLNSIDFVWSAMGKK